MTAAGTEGGREPAAGAGGRIASARPLDVFVSGLRIGRGLEREGFAGKSRFTLGRALHGTFLAESVSDGRQSLNPLRL